MMSTWFTADPHFGHKSVIDFCARPFKNVEDMNEGLIANWNSNVKPGDRVYILGDFAWTTKAMLEVAPRLNGTLRLIVGNHDQIIPMARSGFFQKIDLWRVFRDWNFIATHVPLQKKPDAARWLQRAWSRA